MLSCRLELALNAAVDRQLTRVQAGEFGRLLFARLEHRLTTGITPSTTCCMTATDKPQLVVQPETRCEDLSDPDRF